MLRLSIRICRSLLTVGLAVSVYFWIGCQPVSADPFPAGGEEAVEKVLAAKDFQPRGVQLSLVERAKLYLLSKVKSWFVQLADKLPLDRFRLSNDSWIVRFLKWIAHSIEWVFSWVLLLWDLSHYLVIATLIALTAFVIWRVYKYISRRELAIEAKRPKVQPAKSKLTVDQILQFGATEKGLVAMRAFMRQELSSKHNYSNSLTDREVIRHLANESSQATVVPGDYFKRIANLYESFAFAGLGLNKVELESLFRDFSTRANRE